MKIKAPPGKVIVKFHPFRHHGVILRADRYMPQSVECTVISDSRGEWEGLLAIASLCDGTYFEVEDVKYCVLQRKSMLLFYTDGPDGTTDTIRPATRGVIIEDRGRVQKIGMFWAPENDNRFEGFGKVLAVGPGQWDFKSGDIVHFDRSKAVVLGIDGRRALFIFEPNIFAMEEAA